MPSDEERLRSFYAALSRPEGITEVAENLDPEFELDEFSTGDTSKIYRGRRGFLQWGRRAMTSFSNATLTPLSIETHGRRLLVDLRVRGTGAATGAPVDLVVHHVVELRDGRLYRIAGYLDRAAARAAATG
jgi:ketosteroid isomerase-like protein